MPPVRVLRPLTPPSRGTQLTVRLCRELLAEAKPATLNVAGNRESGTPGIYRHVHAVLAAVATGREVRLGGVNRKSPDHTAPRRADGSRGDGDAVTRVRCAYWRRLHQRRREAVAQHIQNARRVCLNDTVHSADAVAGRMSLQPPSSLRHLHGRAAA